MKNIKRRTFYLLFCILFFIFPIISFAHSGRTDSSGGHHDYQNKSGLGSYHYHHGMGPHLHPNGICPYSGDNSQTSTYTPPSPSISIKDYPTTLYVGESSGFEYSVSNATSDDSSVTSSDTNIVKVNPDNTLTAVNSGTAQITIEASGATKSFTVKVTAIPVEEIKISNEIERIQLGEDYRYKSTILPENATNKNVTWLSDNEDILEINSDGEINTKTAGTVTITVVAENDIRSQTTVEIFEVYPEKIECDDSINLIVGDECKFEIKILPENSNNKTYRTDCDENIFKYSIISSRAISEGETTLHIETWNGITKDIPVKIDIIPVEKIDITDSSDYIFSNIIDRSGKISISAEVSPSNATYQDLNWSSSDIGIIDIKDGEFLVRGTGKVIITCTAHNEIKYNIHIMVIDIRLIIFFILTIICLFGIVICIIVRKKQKYITQSS